MVLPVESSAEEFWLWGLGLWDCCHVVLYPVSVKSSGNGYLDVPNGNISNKACTLLWPFAKLMLMLQASQKGGEETPDPFSGCFPKIFNRNFLMFKCRDEYCLR